MAQGIMLSISQEDSALLQRFKVRTGVDPTTLGQLALHAIVSHLRVHDCLILPMGIEAPKDCIDCPYSRHIGRPKPPPENVIQGPWA